LVILQTGTQQQDCEPINASAIQATNCDM